MISVLTLLITSAAVVTAQQQIQSFNGEATWICPTTVTPTAELSQKCRSQTVSGDYQLLGVQAYVTYPNTSPANPFTTSPDGYHLECSYGTDPNVELTCVYDDASLNLASGSSVDCPRLNSQQPSGYFKRYVVPQTSQCPDTGDNLGYYLRESLHESGSRDPSGSQYFITCLYWPSPQGCGYDSNGNLLRPIGVQGDCPVRLCDPPSSSRKKRTGEFAADPIASRQQTASNLRRGARLPDWAEQ